MTVVCLLGEQGTDVQYELLSRETAREALMTYSFAEPFRNSLAVETVSLGAAVSLCNDLDWYLLRFVDQAIIREPSITSDEWLSRSLATAVRDEQIPPSKTGERLAIYGVVDGSPTEPMYVTRRAKTEDSSYKTLPSYDLRQVEETVVVRVTANEFNE
ncbi:DUF5804 family protein [Haloquadratum walsbyi]|uniref:Uncharacterized protein n=1 Tax=Haloquadratum walsbyi (strain DSM 16790 / HBSQ001) TaxID=362976 RepID=Q18H50_HALWD|nr:DUF5804 family protein [Haloquadratum walsbyi]CAJ52695.1 uncharacterized protein HQ_2583A [Haloquadratum walsbyi DSM 16790]